eukprot:CAMPEP_0201883082 /NCGR_PEP_ID=MMETSP0902-20130614/15134_1 /ASSEMBLY_ACC=CAM_ASM_000551 /TAXON_ID=420261 /ORGANISM="Thalassiosira antarctica, Strain CCMP982" /LENGTH=737 /DNA_ID=CAMNT_0048411793 /DNA_START=12 /DNA_END=2225 /DNA_ORIENTATION=+
MTMTRRVTLVSAVALAATNANVALGFAPVPSIKKINQYATSYSSRTSAFMSSADTTDLAALTPKDPSLNITPEGFGFSSPINRILKSREGMGYYKASGSDSVIDVMDGINSGSDKTDVALVFDSEDVLLGIFTDADYIRLATERVATAQSEKESASFMASPISNFVTSSDKLICVDAKNTASQAVAIMTANNVRHTVLVDKCGPDFSYLETSAVQGVISMQDVLKVIQLDERLSFEKLSKKFPGFADKPMEQMREELRSQANAMADNDETAKRDIIRAVTAILSAGSVALFVTQSEWLHSHTELTMIGIFVLGYIGIIFEEVLEFNKAAVALLMSTGLWVTYADFYGNSVGSATVSVLDQLKDQLAEVSDICFFLLAASTIVEVVDAHQGFKVVTNLITTKSKKGLFWVIGFLTFFLSAILNNLTVTIVMVSLLRKLIPNDEDRRLFGAMVVVAANAGGVWTPIGDVTTTMLWINTSLSTVPTITQLFLPSIVCLVASLAFLVNQVEEDESLSESTLPPPSPLATRGLVVFWAGIACLLSVPVFSELTGLPPYLAMLTGLGAMWTLTDIIHMGEEDEQMKVPAALSKLDTSGILFFLGILMSIGVLDKSGLLKDLAVFLSDNLPSQDIVATVIGIASALIDNVPLVAATMGMYDLADYGTDDKLWQLIALCAGTGGSILVIGSASGVALMGLEKVDFLWYAKKVSVGAAIGYFAGIATYLAQNAVLSGALLGGSVTP